MGQRGGGIEPKLAEFIRRQHVFFVATAPLSAEGRVNVSPKGLDTLAILDEHTIAYLDLSGSGIETLAHVRDNGRIVVMLCAFEGPPKIVRLHGRATAFEPGDDGFDEMRALFPPRDGVRAVFRIDLERVSDSCGYGVPLYEYVGERRELDAWIAKKGPEGLAEYRAKHNRESIDGLPGLRKP